MLTTNNLARHTRTPVTVISLLLFFLMLFAGQSAFAGAGGINNNDTYQVAVREVPPFAFKDATGEWRGMSVDLWREIANKLNLDYRFVEQPLDATIESLKTNQIDAAIAAISVTADREAFIDFSHPYYVSGLSSAYSTQQEAAWLSTLKAFFSIQFFMAVGSLAAVLLAAGFCIWLFERKANAEEFGNGDVKRGLGDGFWWSAVTMTTVGYGDKSPKTLGGRIVALIWMFLSLIIIASFTASIAASLTTNNLVSSQFQSKDLEAMKIGVLKGSAAEEYVLDRGARAESLASVDEALQRLIANEVDTVIHDEPILRYKVRQSNLPASVSESVLVRDDYAFAFPENGNLRDRINLLLLSLLFTPEWDKIKNQYVGQ